MNRGICARQQRGRPQTLDPSPPTPCPPTHPTLGRSFGVVLLELYYGRTMQHMCRALGVAPGSYDGRQLQTWLMQAGRQQSSGAVGGVFLDLAMQCMQVWCMQCTQ